MSERLSTEDRQAVDLLLERPDGHGDLPTVNQLFARPVRGQFEARLETVGKILSLLDQMPSADPPADLVSRTLRRVEEARLEPGTGGTNLPEPTLARDSTAHA
jgi:hypothetical protein